MDLTRTDETMDLGRRALDLLGGGYDGEQITRVLGVHADQAEAAVHAYAARILHGTTPAMPTPECGIGGYDGWCVVHGVYHPADLAEGAASRG